MNDVVMGKRTPLFSILTPVFNPDPNDLISMLESVLAQKYGNWELCIADDCSTNPAIRDILQKFSGTDPRIKLLFREKRGHISAASNSAFSIANGDFVCLVDHDDTIEPDSLEHAARCIESAGCCDMIYSDEDSIRPDGSHGMPYLKPSWSPDLLLSNMYTSHLSFYSRALFLDSGGFREGLEGSQDHDLALRASEKASCICHIPQVLYHWRCATGSTALDLGNKKYAFEAGRKAVHDAVARRFRNGGTVECMENAPGHYRVRYQCPPVRTGFIITGKDKKKLCESINTEISGNDSVFHEHDFICFDRLEAAMSDPVLMSGKYDVLFFVDSDMILPPALPDIMEIISLCIRPGTGAVSGLWIDGNGIIRHAGVILDFPSRWFYSHYGFRMDNPGYMGRLHDVANCAATGRHCFAISADRLQAACGFGRQDGMTSLVDLCLKFYSMGMYNVITPHAIFHTRPDRNIDAGGILDGDVMKYWAGVMKEDPFHHPEMDILQDTSF